MQGCQIQCGSLNERVSVLPGVSDCGAVGVNTAIAYPLLPAHIPNRALQLGIW